MSTVEKSVDLDWLIEGAVAFGGRIGAPIAPSPDDVDISRGTHGSFGAFGDDVHYVTRDGDQWVDPPIKPLNQIHPDALRPWRKFASLFPLGARLGDLDDNTRCSPGLVVLTRLVPKEVRGRAFPAQHTVHLHYLAAPTAKNFHRRSRRDSGAYLGFFDGKWCTTGESGKIVRPPLFEPSQHGMVNSQLAQILEFEYSWQAVFEEVRPGSAKIVIPTDARGALALFKLRDKPDGATRRPALRHWVSAHCRQLRGDRETDVVEHLRGRTEFAWSGMRVSLIPSAFDLERAELAKNR